MNAKSCNIAFSRALILPAGPLFLPHDFRLITTKIARKVVGNTDRYGSVSVIIPKETMDAKPTILRIHKEPKISISSLVYAINWSYYISMIKLFTAHSCKQKCFLCYLYNSGNIELYKTGKMELHKCRKMETKLS